MLTNRVFFGNATDSVSKATAYLTIQQCVIIALIITSLGNWGSKVAQGFQTQ